METKKKTSKRALIIVDVQNDICPGGALAVNNGDSVVPVINRLMDRFELVISSQDWHPRETVHFDKWPPHCIAGTEGAAYHPALNSDRIDLRLLKGTENRDDGYSAFEATNSSLTDYLHAEGVQTLYVCGLTTDYCVKATALDALLEGFHTCVVTDAIAAVNLQPGDDKKALNELCTAGCMLLESDEIG